MGRCGSAPERVQICVDLEEARASVFNNLKGVLNDKVCRSGCAAGVTRAPLHRARIMERFKYFKWRRLLSQTQRQQQGLTSTLARASSVRRIAYRAKRWDGEGYGKKFGEKRCEI